MPGIMPSVAATMVENGFRAIGYTEAQIAQFNFKDKLGFYCDLPQLSFLKTFVRTDPHGGLPKIGCTIRPEFIQDINLDSSYGKLVDRISRFTELIPQREL